MAILEDVPLIERCLGVVINMTLVIGEIRNSTINVWVLRIC